MATQTEHLGLHQWEGDDPFLRTDFNEDFGKIDAGVGQVAADLAAEAQQRAAAVAGVIATGTYVVTSAGYVAVELGFRPRLLVTGEGGANDVFVNFGGVTTRIGSGVSVGTAITLTDTGFECTMKAMGSARYTYYYAALR